MPWRQKPKTLYAIMICILVVIIWAVLLIGASVRADAQDVNRLSKNDHLLWSNEVNFSTKQDKLTEDVEAYKMDEESRKSIRKLFKMIESIGDRHYGWWI